MAGISSQSKTSASGSNDVQSLPDLIKRATDETLTADNWQYILDVCDSISQNPETHTKEALKEITKRLTTRDANVILRTLSLLVAIAENCGSRMKQEIATKYFLQDCLIKKLSDRKLHKQVKVKIAEVIQQLDRSFQNDPSLKPMADAYNVVKTQYRQYLVNDSNVPAPDKPAKTQMTTQDKQKEDLELDRVLKLSLQEYEQEQSIKKNYLSNKPLPETRAETLPPQPELKTNQPVRESSQQHQQKQKQQSPQSHQQEEEQNSKAQQTIATISKVRALYDLISYEPDELSFRKGDVINVLESVYRDWWRGTLPNGKTGIFPLNYVTPVVTKSPEELKHEMEIEDHILNVDARKVDKLLALLSSNPETINEDEITQLYNEIIPIRPTLAKSIDKYSVRKEELLVLHNHLNSEAKLYNEFVDRLINQRHKSQSSISINNNPSLPYPTGGNNNIQSPPAFIPSTEPLQQQPTSAGFGNYNQPPVNYFSTQQQSQQHHQQQPPSQQQQLSQQQQQYSQQQGRSPLQQRQQTGPPPPTSFNQESRPTYDSYSALHSQLYSQPSPQQPSSHPSDQQQVFTQPQQYLNVNRFPDVNSF